MFLCVISWVRIDQSLIQILISVTVFIIKKLKQKKMSAKLIATQVAGVTMGVVGAGLIAIALDKATKPR